MGAHSQQAGASLAVENVDGLASKAVDDNTSPIESTYTSLIQQYLGVLCIDNAIFLAERLVATTKSNHAHHLLAICHYRAGSPQRAQRILEEASEPPCPQMQYLLAKCYFDMKEYGPAEEALLNQCRTSFQRACRTNDDDRELLIDDFILSTTPCPVPNGAAGLYLMGEICRNSNRKERAMNYFRLSLKLDPMMWTSYEALCEMGAKDDTINPTEIFGVCPAALAPQGNAAVDATAAEQAPPQDAAADRGVLTPSLVLSQTPMEARPMETPMSSYMPKTSLFPGRSSAKSLFETPNLTPIPMNETMAAAPSNPQIVNRARKVASRLYYPPSPEDHSGLQSRSLFLSGIDKRSFSVPENTPLEDADGRALFSRSSDTVVAEQSTSTVDATATNSIEETVVMKSGGGVTVAAASADEASVKEILELLCVLGAAQRRLCQYRCREALKIFHQLPREQFHTGWVLHQVGRAYFEMADYQNARRHLELMQQIEPHRLKGLEVLSTTLWHLKKEVELSHLAQTAVDFDRFSPEAWCVVGNCFSLQKEHEIALTFFRRSIQLDPTFTYSHTLSGHEYAAIEDFEKATACYRDAMRVDERHYNAWYGMGAVYFRQEKYDMAEYHFSRALNINPQSPVLHCHLGMAQSANSKPLEALETLAGAFKLDPRNPQARYQRATIFMNMNRPHEALTELEKVRDFCPKEASVHFAMGRVLKKMGRPEQAMRSFLIALDLDPKDQNLIKAAMEKLDEPDVDEEGVSAY